MGGVKKQRGRSEPPFAPSREDEIGLRDRFPPLPEGIQVQRVDFFGEVEKEIPLPDRVVDLEKIGESPERNDIGSPSIPAPDGDGQAVNQEGISLKEFFEVK